MAQAWLIYKQTNMDELFIEPSPSCVHDQLSSFTTLPKGPH